MAKHVKVIGRVRETVLCQIKRDEKRRAKKMAQRTPFHTPFSNLSNLIKESHK